jgi:hypothetical protein
MAFYELRQYKVRQQDRRMGQDHGRIIPSGFESMVICGSFRGETDDSAYVWLRRFSEAEREAVYDSDHWKTAIAPRVPTCLDRSAMLVTRIVATPKSAMP